MPWFSSKRPPKPGTLIPADPAASRRSDDSSSRRQSARREPPTELDWTHAEYVPLPPCPPAWNAYEATEQQRAQNDPVLRPVFLASWKGEHAKVVKAAPSLTAQQRQGPVGAVIAAAYRKRIIQQQKAGRLAAAAGQSLEMFDLVPHHVEEVDKRRFNRIVDQLDKAQKSHGFVRVPAESPSTQPLFQISHGVGWTLESEVELKDDQRPDPAFTVAAIDRAGTWLLRHAKSSSDKPDARAALRRLDRQGRLVAEKQLSHDAYRVGKGSAGSSLAIMDSEGGLHIYDTNANLLVETNLADDPRVREHFRTIETSYWGEFKSQVRAVDVAPETDRYLFTLADEAWCCTLDGRSLWGVAMPLKEGWKRVVGRSDQFGVSGEVHEALRLLDLALPVDPSDITRRYRELAFLHHPDRNPGDPGAEEKMKQLNRAHEILTGIDPRTLSLDTTGKTRFERIAPDHVIDLGGGLTVSLTISMGVPQDWVYAASFAAADGGAFVATYSGKVIRLSREGQARVIYDVGTCPDEILDLGRYTYLLTPTRLYVIEDAVKLAAFLDVFQQGRLIVSESGFGLLTSKTLQWFNLAGQKQGEITTRDPIRALFATNSGAIIQTRRNQAAVKGLMI